MIQAARSQRLALPSISSYHSHWAMPPTVTQYHAACGATRYCLPDNFELASKRVCGVYMICGVVWCGASQSWRCDLCSWSFIGWAWAVRSTDHGAPWLQCTGTFHSAIVLVTIIPQDVTKIIDTLCKLKINWSTFSVKCGIAWSFSVLKTLP
jgi:hypothetical protein